MSNVISLAVKMPGDARCEYLERVGEEFRKFVKGLGISVTHVQSYKAEESTAIVDFVLAFDEPGLDDVFSDDWFA